MSELPIKLVNRQIDYDLAAALGQVPSDFLVLCLDGVPLEGFGTPFDGPAARLDREVIVDGINRKGRGSLWPKFWRNWERKIIASLGLPKDAMFGEFRPVASTEIHRVTAGFSEHLHCAIRLFEEPKVAEIVGRFEVFGPSEPARCKIFAKDGRSVECEADPLSLAISGAVLALLNSGPARNGEASR
jgi:hypothetical protein